MQWSIITKGVSRTVSEINANFWRKSQIFPTPVFLTPQPREFPVKFRNGGSAQKTYKMVERIWRCMRRFRYNTTDRRTDGVAKTVSRSACNACWRAINRIEWALISPLRQDCSTLCSIPIGGRLILLSRGILRQPYVSTLSRMEPSTLRVKAWHTLPIFSGENDDHAAHSTTNGGL